LAPKIFGANDRSDRRVASRTLLSIKVTRAAVSKNTLEAAVNQPVFCAAQKAAQQRCMASGPIGVGPNSQRAYANK
jgi:hypothetical protein